jgi:hypothetical protein
VGAIFWCFVLVPNAQILERLGENKDCDVGIEAIYNNLQSFVRWTKRLSCGAFGDVALVEFGQSPIVTNEPQGMISSAFQVKKGL